MTNYEMIAKKSGEDFKKFGKLAHELYAKYCNILMETGGPIEVDIVGWLHQEASVALDSTYNPGNLLIDEKGRYFVSNGYQYYLSGDAWRVTAVRVICADGTTSVIDAASLKEADIPKQILDLVKAQLLEKIKEHCPIVKEVGNAK